ncbi:hypothetical protein OKW49_006727 [Paraburkholderia youngii]|nr:hypothetical protein [Paraburkholderia youngii]
MRVDDFPMFQALDYVGRTMPDAVVGHQEADAVVGAQHEAHVVRRAGITTYGLPVITAVQHGTGEPVALECAGLNDADAAQGARCLTDRHDWLDA